MKFSISAEILKEGLTKVSKGLSEKTEYGKVIRVAASKDAVSLVTTNGETDYRWTYTNTDHFQTEDAGEVTTVAEKLLGAAEYLKDQVSFLLEDNLVKVSAGKVQLEVKTSDIDISILPPTTPDIRFSFDTALEIPKIIHAMSEDPSKPKMLGVLIDLKSEGENKAVVFKAVQPNRAAKIELTFESDDSITKQIVVPCFIAKMMSSETLKGVSMDGKTLIACFNNYEVRTPVVEIPFMNPDSAFANSGTRSVKFSRNELAKALRLIRASDKQNHLAKFQVGSDSTEISAYNEKTGKSKVTVKSNSAEKFNLSLNFKFVLDLLGSLDGDEEIEFKNEGKIFSYKNDRLHFVTTVFGA
jgi:DNA polymerase III sliding clamp (beta) subunit (PCNA family)